MADRHPRRRLLEAMLDTSNEVTRIGRADEWPGTVTLAREETGASLAQVEPGSEVPAVVMLSRRQARALADALAAPPAAFTLVEEGGDPPPVRLSREGNVILLAQRFPWDEAGDTVRLPAGKAGTLAAAIMGWLREVS